MIELLITAVVLGLALVTSTWSLAKASSSREALREGPYTASLLAKEVHALATTLPRAPSGQVGATAGSDVQALDSLIGAHFSPPVRSDLATYSALTGWAQRVAVDVYATTDLATPTADDPAAGIPPGAPLIYGLTITVEKDGEVEGTYRRWITP